jgi:beta-glucosidase
MKALAAGAYRFSISWPRISRRAPAQRTQRGSPFMTDSSTNSSPMASHPSQRFTTGTYRERCKIAADGKTVTPPRHSRTTPATWPKKFSDRARHFFTLNECWTFVELGHATGVFAPGLKLPPGGLNQLRHHVLLVHGLAVQAIRARSRRAPKSGPRRTSTSVFLSSRPRAHRGSRARHPRAQCALPDRDDGRSLPRVLLDGCRRGRPEGRCR